MKLVLTPAAVRDVDATLRDTQKLFGPRQVDVYSDHIARALEMLAEDPHRPTSKARNDIKEGARSLRLAIAAGRTQGASHTLYYRVDRSDAGEPFVVVMRLLHERMEIRAVLLDDAG